MRSSTSLVPLLGSSAQPEQIRHIRELPSRAARHVAWPDWLHPDLVSLFQDRGIDQPWAHQVAAAELAHGGQNTVIGTGTASGKSLAYLMPTVDAIYRGELETEASLRPLDSVVLYLSPTKALAADQQNSIESLGVRGLRVATYDGDTEVAERRWIRDNANFLLTNPDMLHFGILPNHAQWSRFLRRLKYVVVDEAHSYRGVFGSHVSMVLRRLRRVCALYGTSPVFIGASATSATPDATFSKLLGVPAVAVTEDASPHGATEVVLWEPELTDFVGENGAPQRRSSIVETGDLMANLVSSHVRTISFIRSRRGAEAISLYAKRELEEVDASLEPRVAAYRSGYLAEERRDVEARLRDGRLLGVASTPALELGIDIAGLDAVLIAGWPGTRASFFQEIGRAGRAGQSALAVLIASDDPLDTYLVNHPEVIFDSPLEATVFDPHNPYVAGPHLCAAAAESPLTMADAEYFGETNMELLPTLVERGLLRKRPAAWYWTHPQSAAGMVSIRNEGPGPVSLVDGENGTLLGTMDGGLTHFQAHDGAVYTHQGETFIVDELREEDRMVLLHGAAPDYFTQARDITEVEVLEVLRQRQFPDLGIFFGDVKVQTQVISYQRKSVLSNEVLSEEPLDLEARDLFTKAVWFTLTKESLKAAGVDPVILPGSLHAAEHASIGLLPLVATSDRWDIGGVSTAIHPDTGLPTVFVYDGQSGGSGFAERAYDVFEEWLGATREAIMDCECAEGCPSCIQSPKCGNRNNPLDKEGSIKLLGLVLDRLKDARERGDDGVPVGSGSEFTATARVAPSET